MERTEHYRTLWLSDVHLGAIPSRADDLTAFLNRVSADKLFLVGDIIDLERMKVKPTFIESHRRLLGQLVALAQGPTDVIYIPGNHDVEFRQMAGQSLFGIQVLLEAEHVSAAGERYLVFHGDSLDAAIRRGTNLERFAAAAYTVLVEADVRFNHLRSRLGGRFSPMATRIKKRLKAANEYIARYETTAADYASGRGFDGVICGHIHQPGGRVINGVKYVNDGDWVEHRSAVAENADGQLELLRFRRGGIERELLFPGSGYPRLAA